MTHNENRITNFDSRTIEAIISFYFSKKKIYSTLMSHLLEIQANASCYLGVFAVNPSTLYAFKIRFIFRDHKIE